MVDQKKPSGYNTAVVIDLLEYEHSIYASQANKVLRHRDSFTKFILSRIRSVDKDKSSKTHVDLRLGRAKPGITSGWIWDRVIDFAQGMPPCEEASLPT